MKLIHYFQMYDQNIFIRIFVWGLIGAVVTNQLEVVKTRFQSSYHHSKYHSNTIKSSQNISSAKIINEAIQFQNQRSDIFNFKIYYQLKTIK